MKRHCEISKFADDTKITSQVNSVINIRLMQRTLDRLVAMKNRWDMDFNVNKYGVIYMEKRNLVSLPDE